VKHNCQHQDKDGDTYTQFLDAVIDGSFEYDDFYDCYMWHRPHFYRRRWFWPFKRHSFVYDVLVYCPYCGDKLTEPLGTRMADAP
jgi:hypothetical protein